MKSQQIRTRDRRRRRGAGARGKPKENTRMQSQLERLEGRQLLAWDFAGALELGSGRFVDHTVVIKDLATDGAGHVLLAGEFKGTIDFDTRRNHAFVLESQGTHFFDRVPDGFVAKY